MSAGTLLLSASKHTVPNSAFTIGLHLRKNKQRSCSAMPGYRLGLISSRFKGAELGFGFRLGLGLGDGFIYRFIYRVGIRASDGIYAEQCQTRSPSAPGAAARRCAA